MNRTIEGIHHVTAITSDAQANVDFYSGMLGLRLVKVTVNFDDPGAYHLYYGDASGSPGSILTFFAWSGAYRGRVGRGEVSMTAFAVPVGALAYWQERLEAKGIGFEKVPNSWGETVLSFVDPDGMALELLESEAATGGITWEGATVPLDYTVRGFYGVTVAVERPERTSRLLTGTMGFSAVTEAEGRFRYQAAGAGIGSVVDIVAALSARPGQLGAGSVHHIAWRVPDDTAELAWQGQLKGLGYGVSPVMDRTYFHSVYFREAGGVLFELATDRPGFAVDEAPEQLGTKLMLPTWLESSRPQIEARVPRLVLPGGGTIPG